MNPLLFLILKTLLKFRKVGLVLVGHGYALSVTDPFIESQHQDLIQLDHAIEFCCKLGLRFISMEELVCLSQEGFRNPYSWVHLTFDDGYQNNYTNLYPFLKKSNLPFTLFVTTGAIDENEWQFVDRLYCALLCTDKKFWCVGPDQQVPIPADREGRFELAGEALKTLRQSSKGESENLLAGVDALLSKNEWIGYREQFHENQLLNPMQLAQLASDPLAYIGSHGHRHFSLNSNFLDNDTHHEMSTSKAWLREKLKIETQAFAYPYGEGADFTSMARKICQQNGYAVAFTIRNGVIEPGVDNLLLPRMGIPGGEREFYRRLLKYLLPKGFVKQILWLKRPSQRS